MSNWPDIYQNIDNNCDIINIIQYIENHTNIFGELSKNDYWQGRTLHYSAINDSHVQNSVLDIVKNAHSHIKDMIDKPLYCEHLSIARWPVGYDLQPHADAENPPGFPKHPYPWRDFACITFLNDDFEGGILYFPNQKLEIIPKPGYTIVFPGTLEYLHGVTKITKGNRYTIASFLTYDASKSFINMC